MAKKDQTPMVCAECKKIIPGHRKKRGKHIFCNRTCANRWIAKNRPSSKGWAITSKGYKMIYMPEHPAANKSGYMMEHRLVMEDYLGRLLTKDEVVHHRNGQKTDNRRENLEVMQKRVHDRHRNPTYYATCPHCQEVFPVRGNVHTVDIRQDSDILQ